MAIADFFTTNDSYKAEYQSLLEQVTELTQVRDAYKQRIADLQQQLKNEIAIAADTQTHVDDVTARLSKVIVDYNTLNAQLTSLQSVKVYDQLEYKQFAENSKSEVGGSGNGTHKMTPASAVGMAKIRIVPGPRTDPTKANYFDDYCTLDFPLDDAITRWKMENTFIFATQADADAANCLELEARQVLKDGSMYVAGQQLNFGSNTFRYWDHVKHWTPSGAPCPKFTAGTMYHASVEGHRDATTIYHDAISLNDLRIPLTVSYPSWKESPIWRQMLRCAIQLDAKDTAFEVVIGRTKFTVSN